MLTEGSSVEAAPGAVERARRRHVSGRELEIADEGVAPDGVIDEKAAEPAAGEGEGYQIIAV